MNLYHSRWCVCILFFQLLQCMKSTVHRWKAAIANVNVLPHWVPFFFHGSVFDIGEDFYSPAVGTDLIFWGIPRITFPIAWRFLNESTCYLHIMRDSSIVIWFILERATPFFRSSHAKTSHEENPGTLCDVNIEDPIRMVDLWWTWSWKKVRE